jgi:hypothetical protein
VPSLTLTTMTTPRSWCTLWLTGACPRVGALRGIRGMDVDASCGCGCVVWRGCVFACGGDGKEFGGSDDPNAAYPQSPHSHHTPTGGPRLFLLSCIFSWALCRLAEAFAEKIHLDMRVKYWGYAKEEHLEATDLHKVLPPPPVRGWCGVVCVREVCACVSGCWCGNL